jgi:plastocyanin
LRRILALLLVTPLLANCSDSPTPLITPDSHQSHEAMLEEIWAPQHEAGPVVAQSAQNTGAVVQFGRPELGTSYPAGTHDDSYHARWKLRPGTVTIDAGESVTFNVPRGHRVGIYDDGTQPEDIVRPAGFVINDPNNRLALQPTPDPTYTYTFTEPGRYLVICVVASHFFDGKMYGWVIVR